MAVGKNLDEHMAKKFAENLSNIDGSKSAHWNKEQTDDVNLKYNIKAHDWDFYAALNKAYACYYKQNADLQYYIEIAKGILHDSMLKYVIFMKD